MGKRDILKLMVLIYAPAAADVKIF